jgi:hypothetical protein
VNEDIDRSQLRPDVLAAPAELDAAGDPEFARQAPQAVRLHGLGLPEEGCADNDRSLLTAGEGAGDRAEKHILALPRSQATDYPRDKRAVRVSRLIASCPGSTTEAITSDRLRRLSP